MCRATRRAETAGGGSGDINVDKSTGSLLGGYLRDQLETPLTLVGGFFRMCVLTGKALFRWPFQWREFVLRC